MALPVIREEVRRAKVHDYGHHTVYLPTLSEERLIEVFTRFPQHRFEVFSKRRRVPTQLGNVRFQPVGRATFIRSITTARGVICGGGFETPAEALFLGKRLLIAPMRHQFEQQCNAQALEELGATVLRRFGSHQLLAFTRWLNSPTPKPMYFPDQTESIIDRILAVADPGPRERSQYIQRDAPAHWSILASGGGE